MPTFSAGGAKSIAAERPRGVRCDTPVCSKVIRPIGIILELKRGPGLGACESVHSSSLPVGGNEKSEARQQGSTAAWVGGRRGGGGVGRSSRGGTQRSGRPGATGSKGFGVGVGVGEATLAVDLT